MIPRAGRIAARLAIEFAVAHVVNAAAQRVDQAMLDALRAEARKTNVEWIDEVGRGRAQSVD